MNADKDTVILSRSDYDKFKEIERNQKSILVETWSHYDGTTWNPVPNRMKYHYDGKDTLIKSITSENDKLNDQVDNYKKIVQLKDYEISQLKKKLESSKPWWRRAK